jgi:hypothetical protein
MRIISFINRPHHLLLNDIKVKKEKNKVNNIKEVCVKQIEDILEDYILFLKRVIK